jgi:hypothetical protein
MADFGGDLDAFRARSPRLAEGQLSGRAGEPDRRARGGDVGRPRLRGLGRSADRLDEARRRARLDRADLADPVRRRRPRARQGAHRGAGAGRYRPPLVSFGIWMLGPVLLEFANEAQKAEHLPKIIQGEIRWCQGYSEPGAGSDLASLQTRCEDKGDHWLINGQKIWTSYANKADWCFCLVRTDPAAKKHEGISLRADRHGDARRRDAADQADQRREPVLRDLLHRREDPQGQPGRAAQQAAGTSPSGCCSTSGRTSPAASAAGAAPAARPATSARSPSATSGRRDRRGGRRRPARPHHPQQDGLPGFGPDHRRASPPKRGPATAPPPRPRSSSTPPRLVRPGALGADGRGDGRAGLGWEGEDFSDAELTADPRLAALEGQFDRGRHQRSEHQRGLQAGARPARSEVGWRTCAQFRRAYYVF